VSKPFTKTNNKKACQLAFFRVEAAIRALSERVRRSPVALISFHASSWLMSLVWKSPLLKE